MPSPRKVQNWKEDAKRSDIPATRKRYILDGGMVFGNGGVRSAICFITMKSAEVDLSSILLDCVH